MTDSEKQIIIDAVISAMRTNSRTIEQLTPVAVLSPEDCFEINGGRRIAYSALTALFEAISAKDRDKLQVAIDRKELRKVSIDASQDSATLIIESVGKTIQCSIPVATSSQSGIITAADKIKFNTASENAAEALTTANAAKKVTDTVGKPGGLATLDKNGKVPDDQIGDKYKKTVEMYSSSWKNYLETTGTDYTEESVTIGVFHQGPDDDVETRELDILAATHENAGVMSARDKVKLDALVESPSTVQAMTTEEVMECCH